MMMTCLRLIGGLLDDTQSPPSALHRPSPCGLTFYPAVHLGVDTSVDPSIDLVLVGGAYRVPQVPVPQTCQSQAHEDES